MLPPGIPQRCIERAPTLEHRRLSNRPAETEAFGQKHRTEVEYGPIAPFTDESHRMGAASQDRPSRADLSPTSKELAHTTLTTRG
jgi:hypothetical protein